MRSEAPVAARTELSVEFAPVDHTGRMHPVDEGQCRFRPGAPSLCFLLLRKVIDGNVTTAMQRATADYQMLDDAFRVRVAPLKLPRRRPLRGRGRACL